MSGPDDLDALVTELNAGAPRPATDGHTARLRAWLELIVARSFTLEESLTELVRHGLVDRRDALARWSFGYLAIWSLDLSV